MKSAIAFIFLAASAHAAEYYGGTVGNQATSTVGTMTVTGNATVGSLTDLGTATIGDTLSVTQTGATQNAITVVSTGTGNGISVTCQGGNTIQGDSSGCINVQKQTTGSAIVVFSSHTSAQIGDSLIYLHQKSGNWNDPLFRIIDDNFGNSSPQIRIDGRAVNVEAVNTSTTNSQGLGKWEPFAMALGGINLQVNSRAEDDSGFQNVGYWTPLNRGGGLTLAPAVNGAAGNVSTTASGPLTWLTPDAHTVGIKGPLATTASWSWVLPSVRGSSNTVLGLVNNVGGMQFVPSCRPLVDVDSTTVGVTTTTAAGTGELDMAVITIPANSLTNKGDRIKVEAAWTGAGDANTKRARIRANGSSGTICSDTLAHAVNAGSMVAYATIRQAGNSSQTCDGTAFAPNFTGNAQSSVLTLDNTASFTIDITCQNGSSVAGDCSFVSATVELCSAPQ